MSFQNVRIIGKDFNPLDYHQKYERGTPQSKMSSSALKLFMQCPHRFVKGYEPTQSDAKDYGNLWDCLLLTPKMFSRRYAEQPATYVNEDGETRPWNNNAKVCRKWVEEQGDKEVVKTFEIHECDKSINALVMDTTINSFLEQSDRQVCVEGEWLDKATGLAIPARCLIDLQPRKETEFASCLGDAKSTRTASVHAWKRDCYNFGYHIQGAWNLDMFNAATGELRDTFCFILQESYAPWESGKRMLSQDFVALGRLEYQNAMAAYAKCLKTGVWPGYDDAPEAVQGWSLVEPDQWMHEKALAAIPATEEVIVEPEGEKFDVIP